MENVEARLIYANRLSDHLFVLARHLNEDGAQRKTDTLWLRRETTGPRRQPGKLGRSC